MISALPITIGGLGMREGAALLLLGFYGVPAAEAVDASLLTFLASLTWTIAGGLLWWREGSRPLTNRTLPTTISVVIPALNEARHLPETIRQAQKVPQICEIIVVDGGSSDDTCRLATELGCTVLQHDPGRGGQMRRGAEQARGDIVLLLHADTWLPPKSGEAIINCLRDTSVVAGGFWKSFREPVLMGSRLRCAIRLYLGKRIMGDQAIFIVRDELEQVGGVPDMPLMEEFELCRRLRQRGRLALADATVTTSARRFKQLGVLRTYLRMWMVTLRYWLGTSPKELNRLYEKEAVRRPAEKI
jgi:rSAM/selenodomain-associated transferase 2